LRLARESAALNHIEENADLDDLVFNSDDDKSFAALSVAKTIGTVSKLSMILQQVSLYP